MRNSLERTQAWFAKNDWTVFDFQRNAWQAWHEGKSGLIHSPTGSGKTLAAWLGPVQAEIDARLSDKSESKKNQEKPQQLKVLWITPLRALASDTREHLEQSAKELGADLEVEMRTGDTSTTRRSKQRNKPPFALVTTPESLSVMLSYPHADRGLSGIHTVVVDEWHELLASKRGVQLQLCLARLKTLCPELRIWGVSATLSNLYEAMQTLLGPGRKGSLIRGVVPRAVEVGSVLPRADVRFKWSGHLGVQLVEPVIDAIKLAQTSLLFTNTRSQAELWFRALLDKQPSWIDHIALHHGSIDRKLRQGIEERLRSGDILCVVCTSSLDLGVDFSPVDQVLQVGSPKGVARLIQRAGRSGHRPGVESRILCVPTNALELVEIAAVRKALNQKRIEARSGLTGSLDVLCQHLVTIAMGQGFVEQDMLKEVRNTHAFAELNDVQWRWAMDFITRGGQALQGYPQYHKVLPVAGVHRVMNKEVAKRHRMSIGTIASDTQISIVFKGGKRLGTTEESFISRMNPGDTFQFAGRHLELIRIREMSAQVKKASRRSRAVPRWWGTQLPMSCELADSVQEVLVDWKSGQIDAPELSAISDYLNIQQRWSLLPGPDDFLIEYIQTSEGYSLFCYPFAGRLAHEGLAMVVASRLSSERPATFTLQINDYGFELQSPEEIDLDLDQLRPAFTVDNLLDDILSSINSGEIAKRRFRDIARISGLVFDGYPGQPKSSKQIQASSGLIFEVLSDYDKENLLLDQARTEVLEQQLEYQRLKQTLLQLEKRKWHLSTPERLTPLAFPLWAESLQSQTISTEPFNVRVNRMLGSLEDAAAV